MMTNVRIRRSSRGLAVIVLAAAVMVPAVILAGATCADIEKFYWIDHRVATGGQPTAEQLASLKREGFRTIINLREPSEYDAAAEAAEARKLNLAYVSIPVRTSDPKDEQVDAFLAAMGDTKIWPVFVHCGTANRVAAFWMIHRVVVDGWAFGDAESEARLVGLKSANLKEFAYEYVCRHGKAEGRPVPCSNRGTGTD
jgi:uncharacterized protein (TIGR01244 family)